MSPKNPTEQENDESTAVSTNDNERQLDWLTEQLLSYLAPMAREFIRDLLQQTSSQP